MCVLVTQSCPTLCDPMDHSPPGSSIHRILQARILGWVAISFSRIYYIHIYNSISIYELYVYVYKCICMYMYIHVYMYVYVCICVCICMENYSYTAIYNVYIYIYIYLYIYVSSHVSMFIYIYIFFFFNGITLDTCFFPLCFAEVFVLLYILFS